MNEYAVPAQPGTTLHQYVEGFYPIPNPVICWRVTSAAVKPVILADLDLANGAYVVEIGGAFVNFRDGLCFDSIEEWIAHVEDSPPPVADGPVLKKGGKGEFDLQFGTKKPFKSKSFWCFEDATRKFAFEIEGGEQLPDDPRASKVNRDTFIQIKKAHGHMPLARLIGAVGAPTAPADEEFDDGGLL